MAIVKQPSEIEIAAKKVADKQYPINNDNEREHLTNEVLIVNPWRNVGAQWGFMAGYNHAMNELKHPAGMAKEPQIKEPTGEEPDAWDWAATFLPPKTTK